MGILVRLITTSVALLIATWAFSGITLEGSASDKAITLLIVAAIFGIINAVLRPIIKTIGCFAYVITLGLIALVVNGALFMLTSFIADKIGLSFHVENFWPTAVCGALFVSLASWALNLFVPDGKDD